MLSEYRNIYAQAASMIPDYKKISQIELAEKYLEGGPLKDSYLAALILRYWNVPSRLYAKDRGLYEESIAYDWYINALMYLLDVKPWRTKTSSVYNDPKAIEKILNTCVKCDRANWFQASNRYKRMINHNANSLEALSEEYKDAYLPPELTIATPEISMCDEYIHLFFTKQQYLFALMIDVICKDINLQNVKDDITLVNAIRKSIKTLPSNYSKVFAEEYDIPLDKVDESFKYIYNMSDDKLKSVLSVYVCQLREILSGDR